MCFFKKTKDQSGKKDSTMKTLEQLYDALRTYRDIYESKEYYCWLTAFYDDGIRSIDCGSSNSRDTQTIESLIEYIPKRLYILMEKPDYLRFKLIGGEIQKMGKEHSIHHPKTYIDMIVSL